ncbi:DUF2461 domain-containing protein [Hoyosella sp. G463]|uniref:DUF2461 domain-containing protein n=1 Tax=Lolliginicoccus lacisalsi TaxID=2742202 RepID=A0A927PLZ6_9ACTN|nr:DUF2461 domain-containing protein [Lolliginicoccus lacisalsi]MBD8506299.1 DUF2461 domain-containing protein [Lolliginicoccus lacisalsi]
MLNEFTGFPVAALDFYEDLEADNSKQFWTSNKHIYENAVKGPMVAMLSCLEAEFGPAKLFRPNRDVRFSRDKAPYKTHQGAYVGSGQSAGWYVQIDAAGIFIGAGFYGGSTTEITAYRRAVDDETTGPELETIVDSLRADYEIGGEQLKTHPRGFAPDHPRITLLRHKSITVGQRHVSPEWLSTPEALDRVRGTWRELRPLVEWLTRNTA